MKMKILIISIVLICLVGGFFIYENTPEEKGPVKIHNQNISGEIKQDQIWSGTIHVTGDIWMSEEITLTIMPGTTVLISAGKDDQNRGNALEDGSERAKLGPLYTEKYAKSHIEIVGRIIAIGQPDKMIRFTSDSPTPNYADWNEIRLYPGSRIEYSIVEYAGRAGIAWQGHGEIKDANISISNSIIQHVFWGCVALGPGSWKVVSNTISDCGSEGIDTGPLSGKPYIARNNITNSTVGIATDHRALPIIENNVLIDNVKGILSRGNDTITHNSISSPSRKIHEQSYMGYTFPYIAEPPVITFTGIQIAENPVSTIEFNDISNNQRGISIGPQSNPVLTIRNNNIYKNDYNIYLVDFGIAVNASNNWWGTTDTNKIAERIRDYHDDARLGVVNYIPIQDAPVQGVANATISATTTILASELGLPEGYKAEFLLQPDLLSPLFITTTSDDQLLVAEHYGSRLLRINPLTAKINVLYNLPRVPEWNALVSDGADGAYLQIQGNVAHIDGNGSYTSYYQHPMNPAALGPNGEIYGYTKSDVFVLRSKDEEPKIIATGFSAIADLVRDKEGNLYVSDWDLGTITRINLDGTKKLLTSAVNQKDPIELGFSPDGTLYVDEGIGKFSQIDTDTGNLKKIDWFGGTDTIHPTDFAFFSNGKAYFVDPSHNNIMGVDLQKEEVELVIRGGGNSRALDIGPDGAVYFGDSNGYPFYRSKILRIQNNSVEVYAENLDAIIDISFAPNGNMFVTTRYRRGMECGGSSVFLITPERNVKTLASWNCSEPGARGMWSISVNPKTGVAVAYDEGNGELISVDENGKVSVLPNSFNFDAVQSVYLDHAPDGTLYAIETNKKDYTTGPLVERNIIQFDDYDNPKIVTDFNHIGCCTTDNIAIAPDGTIYVLGYKLESNDMSLWRVTKDGEKILLSDKLPIDPLSVAADSEGNIFVASSAGLLRIWK